MGKSWLSSPCSNGLPRVCVPGSAMLSEMLQWGETEAHRQPCREVGCGMEHGEVGWNQVMLLSVAWIDPGISGVGPGNMSRGVAQPTCP